MSIAPHVHQFYLGPPIDNERYKFYIEAVTVGVLCYIGYMDFRTFKIRNSSIILLLVLYVIDAALTRSQCQILSDISLAGFVFSVMLVFYKKRLIGGGDVKILSVVCLWVGPHCALLFAVALLAMTSLHLLTLRMGLSSTISREGRRGMAYAPSVAGALIVSIVLGRI